MAATETTAELRIPKTITEQQVLDAFSTLGFKPEQVSWLNINRGIVYGEIWTFPDGTEGSIPARIRLAVAREVGPA